MLEICELDIVAESSFCLREIKFLKKRKLYVCVYKE